MQFPSQHYSTTNTPVNLKAMQEEIQCSLQVNITVLVENALKIVQQDASMSKLDTQYNELSHPVHMLHQQFEQKFNN